MMKEEKVVNEQVCEYIHKKNQEENNFNRTQYENELGRLKSQQIDVNHKE